MQKASGSCITIEGGIWSYPARDSGFISWEDENNAFIVDYKLTML